MHSFPTHKGGPSEQALCKNVHTANLLPIPHTQVEAMKISRAMLLARLFCQLLSRQHTACSLSAELALKSNLP